MVDGEAGPITLSKLFPKDAKEETLARDSNDELRERIVKVAQRYVGHKEVSENSSPLIDKWLQDCGIDFPAAWCMAGVQGWVKEACDELGIADVLLPNSAGVLDTYRKTMSERIGPRDGKRGDIICLDYGSGRGHTGVVIGYQSGYYICVEGNSNAAGSREADQVTVNKRKYNDPRLRGFIRVSINQ